MALFDDPMGLNAEGAQALTSLASESPVNGEIAPPETSGLPSGAGGGFLSSTGGYAPVKPQPSTDWGAIISKVGQAITAGGAGFAGNPNYLETVKRTELAQQEEQRRAEENQQHFQLQRMQMLPQAMQIAQWAADNLDADQKEAFAPQLDKIFQGTGFNFGQDFTKSLLTNANKLDQFNTLAPHLSALPDKIKLTLQAAVNKNPANTEKILQAATDDLAIQLHTSGQDIPKSISMHVSDPIKAQIGMPTSKTLQTAQDEAVKGSKPDSADLMTTRMFGVPWKDASPEQKQRASMAVDAFKNIDAPTRTVLMGRGIFEPTAQDIASASKEANQQKVTNQITVINAKEAAAAGRPVSDEKISEWTDINGRTPLQDAQFKTAGERTADKLIAAGYGPVPRERRTQLNAANTALVDLGTIEKQGTALFKGVKPGDNLGNALKLRGQQVLGEEGARNFERVLLRALPTNAIATGLTPGSFRGVKILEMEKAIMPNLTDTEASFKQAVQESRRRLEVNRRVAFGAGVSEAELLGGAGAAEAPTSGGPVIRYDATGKRVQ